MKITKKAVRKAKEARKKEAAKNKKGAAKKGRGMPQTKQLYAPVLQTLQEMGGVARKREAISRIVEEGKYPDSVLKVSDAMDRSVLENRIQWARAVLVRVGYVEEAQAGKWGLWELTDKGRRVNLGAVSEDEFIRSVNQMWGTQRAGETQPPEIDDETTAPPEEEVKLEDELLSRLRSLKPKEFEHLCMRVLTAVGFTNVKVTKETRDGGFDGTGTLEVNPFITTSIVFECKRYEEGNVVTVAHVERLRGKIADGVAQKGAIITTSRFTRDAHVAVARGDSPIELIDGDKFVQLMVKHRIGVREVPTLVLKVNDKFFSGFEKDESPAGRKAAKKKAAKKAE